MAAHSSILVSEIPWTEEPAGLQSIGSKSNMIEVTQHKQEAKTLYSDTDERNCTNREIIQCTKTLMKETEDYTNKWKDKSCL